MNPSILRSKVQVFLDLYVNQRRLADEVEAHKRTLADLDAFNYSVSHDLRAPLRHLSGFTQMLLEDCGDKLDERARGYMSRIQGAAQRMTALIDDLLRLSRISRAQLKVQSVDLSSLAETIIGELRTGDPGRDVVFHAEPGIVVRGDSGLLRIVLENLLRNAWKFTGKKPHCRIELGRRIDQEETVYSIRDDGVGFDPGYASKLFQPFQRLHSNTDFEGTGIGLAIVHRIIGHHRGRIWVEASPDQGATFYFTLRTAQSGE